MVRKAVLRAVGVVKLFREDVGRCCECVDLVSSIKDIVIRRFWGKSFWAFSFIVEI